MNPKIPIYHYDGGIAPVAPQMSDVWAERFVQPTQISDVWDEKMGASLRSRNLQYVGEILCLGIGWGDTIRILDRVEKGDRLNGVRVESCEEDGNGYLVNFLPVNAAKKFKEGGMIVHHKKVAQIQPKAPEYKCLALLDEPYYRLAIRRTTQALTRDLTNAPLNTLFEFSKTPEGHTWWWSVASGQKPTLPDLSKKELEDEFVTPNTI